MINHEKTNPVKKFSVNWHVASFFFFSLIILGVCALLLFYKKQNMEPVPKQKSVETVSVKTGDVSKTVKALGKLDLFHFSDVNAQIPGQIKQIYVSIGDTVKEGKLLAEIIPAEDASKVASNRAQLARLEAELADQSAQAEFMQIQFQRQTRLQEDNATREEDVQASRMNMLSSTAKVAAIRAQIEQINAVIKEDDATRKKTKILAPMNGTIISIAAHNGQIINGNQSTLLRIADLSRMTVQARVEEKDVTKLSKGMTAIFTTAGYPGERRFGKLNQIMPLAIDDNTQLGKWTFYTALFDVTNTDHKLMSGMNVDVDFVLANVDDVLTLPIRAFNELPPDSRASTDYTVQILNASGKLLERKVKIGLIGSDKVQVISGLHQGERVAVMHPSDTTACSRLTSNEKSQ